MTRETGPGIRSAAPGDRAGAHGAGATDILRSLREETRAQHAELEQRLDFPEAFGSLAAYRRVLECFYSVLLPLETWLARHGSALPSGLELPRRRRAQLIVDDLAGLGFTAAPAPAPRDAPQVAALDSAARLMGSLYTLEGSTLGGQFICRQMVRMHGEEARGWLRFFHGHGSETGRMWSRFQQRLESFAVSRDEHVPGIVAGARITFEMFAASFVRPMEVAHDAA